MWGGIWTTKAILLPSQIEMRSMLWETGGKVILVTKWQTTCLIAFVFSCFVEVRTCDEIGSLAEEISKQNAEGASGVLTAYGKI